MGQMGAWLSYRDIFFLPAKETGGGTSVSERAEQNQEQRRRLNLFLNLCHGNTQQSAQRECFEWLERLFGVQVDQCDFSQQGRDGV